MYKLNSSTKIVLLLIFVLFTTLVHLFLKQQLEYKKLDAIYDNDSVTEFELLNNDIKDMIHCSKLDEFKIERHINLKKIRTFDITPNCIDKKNLSAKMGELRIEYILFKKELILYQTYKTGINLLPHEFIIFKPDDINNIKRDYKLIDNIDNQIYIIQKKMSGNTM